VGVIEAAEGIVRILSDNMMRACRFVTIEKGYDPRDFGLCAFGGAGPMYAVDIARELAIPTVVIPRFPGVFSAYGLLRADIVYDASRTLLIEIADLGEEDAEEIFAGLEGTVLDRFAADHVQRDEVTFRREMEMLFTGQVHALSVPFPSGAFDVAAREALLEHFYAEHRRAYGHAEPGDPVTLVTARVFGERPRPVRELAPADTPTPSSERSTREVHFSGHGFVDTALVPRSSLVPGEALSGPALVTQVDATTILPPGTLTTLTPQGDLLVEVSV
jgi:N-methylhydantoinase A